MEGREKSFGPMVSQVSVPCSENGTVRLSSSYHGNQESAIGHPKQTRARHADKWHTKTDVMPPVMPFLLLIRLWTHLMINLLTKSVVLGFNHLSKVYQLRKNFLIYKPVGGVWYSIHDLSIPLLTCTHMHMHSQTQREIKTEAERQVDERGAEAEAETEGQRKWHTERYPETKTIHSYTRSSTPKEL